MNASTTRKRLVSATLGAIIVAIGIFLQSEFPDRPMMVQIIVWSLLVFAIMIWGNSKDTRERWFWIAFCIAVCIHIAVVGTFWNSLPFKSLGVVILFAIPETIVLQGIFRAVSRS